MTRIYKFINFINSFIHFLFELSFTQLTNSYPLEFFKIFDSYVNDYINIFVINSISIFKYEWIILKKIWIDEYKRKYNTIKWMNLYFIDIFSFKQLIYFYLLIDLIVNSDQNAFISS